MQRAFASVKRDDNAVIRLIALEWTCLMMAVLVFNPQTNSRHLVLLLLPVALGIAMLLYPVSHRAWWLTLLAIIVLFAALNLPPGSRRIEWMNKLRGEWFSLGGPSWLILCGLALFLNAGLLHSGARGSQPP